MTQLNDNALEALLTKNQLIKNYSKSKNKNSVRDVRLQPASFDITVGAIYRVPRDSEKRWTTSEQDVGNSYVLEPGETILVESSEELDVPQNIAGLGSPPASLSSKGMLMVSPGHIDPGYRGRLLFTLINMGKESLPIKHDEAIFTTVWFNLAGPPDVPYEQVKALINTTPSPKDRTHEYLSKLSRDFLNVDTRATNSAKSVIVKYGFWGAAIGITFTILVTIGPNLISMVDGDRKQLNDLQNAVITLESDVKTIKTGSTQNGQQAEIEQMRSNLVKIEKSLEKLEGKKLKTGN